MSFFTSIREDRPGWTEKAVQGIFISDAEFTSVLHVDTYERINIGIWIGSQVSDIISAKGGINASVVLGEAISAIFSTASMTITLQRQMKEEMSTDFWHDVDAWSVTIAEGEEASSENISNKPEPEPVAYRIGIKKGEYESGLALIRLGTM